MTGSRRQFVPFGALVCLLGCWLTAGCRVPTRIGVTETGAPSYDRATVVYELNGFQRPLPLTPPVVSPVAYEPEQPLAADATPSNWACATLSIQYPHPEGNTELARAVLRLSARPGADKHTPPEHVFGMNLLSNSKLSGASTEKDDADSQHVPGDELWVREFPKQQRGLRLSDLASGGFFQAQLRNDAGAHLDVQLDRGRTQKSWTSEPRLDHFIARVYREGRLGGFVPCDAKG